MRLRTLAIDVTGGGHYLFVWRDARDQVALFASIGALAEDPELPDFTWKTAFQVGQHIRQSFPDPFPAQ